MAINMLNDINNYFTKIQNIINAIDKNSILDIAHLLINKVDKNCNIYVLGNGGSATTASHFQNDFNISLADITTKKFNFICLSDNIPTITAIANDYSYEEIFVKQLENRITNQDLIIAISGSGNSTNIIKAAKYGKNKGATIIALTGFDGGILKSIADYNLNIDCNNMQIAEDFHLIFNHLLVTLIHNHFTL